MTKVLYLLGAGASALAIPAIYGMGPDMENMADILNKEYDGKIENPHNNRYHIEFCKRLRLLAEKTKEYGTPDNYASYIQKREEVDKDGIDLEIIKRTLALYFIVKQTLYKASDRRYKAFLSKFSADEIGKYFNVISWNYDYQFEIAIKDPDRYGDKLAYFKPYPFSQLDNECTKNDCTLVHLNGISGMVVDRIKPVNHSYLMYRNDTYTYEYLIEEYNKSCIGRCTNIIHFGFEEEEISLNYKNKTLDMAKNMAKEADILVVIGYSFPDYNVPMDNQYFQSFRKVNGGKLKKIYIQDLNPDKVRKVMERRFPFLKDESIEIIPDNDVDDFYIPEDVLLEKSKLIVPLVV